MIKTQFDNQTLIINPRGGGIAEYYVEQNGQRHDIIYGYSSERDRDGSLGDVLSPFPGRVERSEYDFDSIHYKLKGFAENRGNALHAFVRELDWQVKEKKQGVIASTIDVEGDKYSTFGYPFSLKITIFYTLGEDGLTVETTVKNCGLRTAPFGLGFHPYFKVAVQVDEMVWQVPAKKLVEFNSDLRPTGKFLDISDSRLDFREAKAIGGDEIDNCFTDLIRDRKGIFTSTLTNLTRTKQIQIWQDKSFPYFQAYSADTIADRNFRQAMALEPQTCCGYAVNLDGLGLIKLKPSEEFKGSWGVKFKLKN